MGPQVHRWKGWGGHVVERRGGWGQTSRVWKAAVRSLMTEWVFGNLRVWLGVCFSPWMTGPGRKEPLAFIYNTQFHLWDFQRVDDLAFSHSIAFVLPFFCESLTMYWFPERHLSLGPRSRGWCLLLKRLLKCYCWTWRVWWGLCDCFLSSDYFPIRST